MAQVKIEMEKKERELYSYKKTIKALTDELDGLGGRVHELEHAMMKGSKETHGKMKGDSVGIEEVRRELEDVKEEKAKYQEMFQMQTEKVWQVSSWGESERAPL